METALAYIGGFIVFFLVAIGMMWLMSEKRHNFSPDKAKENLENFKRKQQEKE